ncbi:MAG: PCRF domain-containing protein, partial [Dehalococcoidia bacterium]|nr:PCRF domain-containing protein [Dehalococcoidia bacterium]
MEPLLTKLASIEARYQEIERLMATPEVATDYERVQTLAKERASLEDMVSMYREYRSLLKEKEGVLAILGEGSDPEMASLARQELEALERTLSHLDQGLRVALLPKDPND